ncbi:hypothetical protein [Geminocystis sp. GBBB08]|uniref:hypothetical protein n=1 Tax=Geminocystis sp. GBBB08 TaxID=2604140 RepID=UPI0027E333CF|nr:hypothetical protein [Geminocystis sp. GBBB08]MBL1210553.1 hypothetical protein [Geminocystis sp. GBBB08]
MGFKTLIFFIIVIIIILLFIQNLQPISLVFLGFNSLSLPLSLWLLFALFMGMLSSLIIQILSNNLIPKTKSNQSFSSNNISNNPPPSPPSFTAKPITEKKAVYQPPMSNENIKKNNQFNEFDNDLDFDDIPENIEKDNQILEEKKQVNYSNNIDLNTPLEKELITTPDIILEKELNTPVSEDIPLETFLKPREASIYSYQSGEKTEIKPKSSTFKPNQKKQSSPKNPNQNYQERVYDAPYRIIAPASENKDKEIYNDFDEDDDWDF